MRTLAASLIATICLCVGAPPSSAFTLWISGDFERTLENPWVVGEKANVVLYLEADQPGIQLLSVGVLFDDSVFAYNPKPNSSVGVPSYVLYGMSGMMSNWLTAVQSTWALWPGATPPGTKQVNVDWAEITFDGTYATGFAKIAELEFEVITTGDGIGDIDITLTGAGNIFQVNGNPNTPLLMRYGVPEPTTAVLLGLGLAGLLVARGRRVSS